MKKSLIILLTLMGINGYVFAKFIPKNTVSPVAYYKPNAIQQGLVFLGCPKEKIYSIGYGIRLAEIRTGIEGLLIVSLLRTESNFRTEARSKKGYKGLMQTPTATKIPEVDILHGAMILKDKLHLTKGNMLHALTLYKGGNNQEARKQAKEVLVLYRKVKVAVG
jgi:soluble lytic murein transglycosylase-like protein